MLRELDPVSLSVSVSWGGNSGHMRARSADRPPKASKKFQAPANETYSCLGLTTGTVWIIWAKVNLLQAMFEGR